MDIVDFSLGGVQYIFQLQDRPLSMDEAAHDIRWMLLKLHLVLKVLQLIMAIH